MTTREIFDAALALPSEERAKLVDELAASLEQQGDIDDEVVEIVRRREADFRKGTPGISADEVFDELLAK